MLTKSFYMWLREHKPKQTIETEYEVNLRNQIDLIKNETSGVHARTLEKQFNQISKAEKAFRRWQKADNIELTLAWSAYDYANTDSREWKFLRADEGWKDKGYTFFDILEHVEMREN